MFTAWYEIHKTECSVNHDGSSGLMKVAAAKEIWICSSDFELRYNYAIRRRFKILYSSKDTEYLWFEHCY